MWLAKVFGIHQDVIQLYHNKDIKILSKNLIDVVLKTNRCVGKTEKHDLILQVTVSGTKGRFPFITFSNPHLIISIREI